MAEPAHDFQYQDDIASMPEQGAWTWDDYLRLPDDGKRYEIIHGVLYVSPAPRLIHQFVVGRLVHFLTVFGLEHRFGAVLPAPIDILLPGVANPVQPDVVFLASNNLPDLEGAKFFQGIPDLVIEVLSPRTQRLDLTVKLKAYEKAGVPEYWIVDARQRTVLLYNLQRPLGEGHLQGGHRGFQEPKHFAADEIVRSKILAGFELKVADLFPPS